jgi:hypothetical protein
MRMIVIGALAALLVGALKLLPIWQYRRRLATNADFREGERMWHEKWWKVYFRDTWTGKQPKPKIPLRIRFNSWLMADAYPPELMTDRRRKRACRKLGHQYRDGAAHFGGYPWKLCTRCYYMEYIESPGDEDSYPIVMRFVAATDSEEL